MLTAGNVSDIKAAPALLERAGRMRYLLATKAMTPTNCGARCETQAPFRSSLDAATASAPSVTTRVATVAATSSRTPSAASSLS